jgi:N-methylhydantoinase B
VRVIDQSLLDIILANVPPDERNGDLHAQIGANQRGVHRLAELISHYGMSEVTQYMQELLLYTEHMTRRLLVELPDGSFSFEDYIDSDGISNEKITLKVTITIHEDTARVDFTGSPTRKKHKRSLCNHAIGCDAFSFIDQLDVPNGGCNSSNPSYRRYHRQRFPAAFAGGNVNINVSWTYYSALCQACPDRIPHIPRR